MIKKQIGTYLDKIKTLIIKTLKLYLSNDLLIFSGASSFFIIISSIPLFMIMFSTITLVPSVDIKDFINNINLLFPDIPYMTQVIEYTMRVASELSKSNAISINIITSLITSSTCLLSFTVGIRKIHTIKHTNNYILIKIMTIFNIFILYITVILTVLFFMIGKLSIRYLSTRLPLTAHFLSSVLKYKYLTIGMVLFFLMLSLYTCCTSFRRKYRENILGSLFTTFMWLFISKLFSIYFANFPMKQQVYGSLAGIILTLIWLYICINLIFIGACINEIIKPTKHLS